MTWDLDLFGLFDLFDLAGIPIRREARSGWDPAVLVGGPLTASNPLPLADFIDFAVIGDGELAVPAGARRAQVANDRDDMFGRLATIAGVWIPERDGDRVPPTQKVTVGLPARADCDAAVRAVEHVPG